MPWLQEPSLRSPVARLVEWARTRPDAPAFVNHQGTVTYAALLRAVRAQARRLHAWGVRRKDTVAIAFVTQPEQTVQQIAQFYAIAWLGAAILPLYPEVPTALHGQLAALFGAQWLVADQPPVEGTVRWLDSREWTASPADTAPEPPCVDDASLPFLYEFTSGTTGTPQAVCYSNAQYIAKAVVTAQQYGWAPTDVMVPAVRWPSKVGLRAVVRTLVVGACHADFPFPEDAAQLSDLVETHGVTYLGCSPWQVRRLLAGVDAGIVPPVRVQKMGVVGAWIAPYDIQAARSRLCHRFCVRYAITEIGTIGLLGPDDPPQNPFSVVPGMECQALSSSGQPVAVGQTGQLRFRAPWAPQNYAIASTRGASGFHDGWFVSSDLGSVDAQGRITLLGRADEAINCGGLKIQPQEVEQALLAHPDVADAAVVGVPDALAGEIAVAFLVLHRPIALDTLLAFLQPRLEPAQIPAAIAGMEEIPRNPEGKILRNMLRDVYTVRKG